MSLTKIASESERVIKQFVSMCINLWKARANGLRIEVYRVYKKIDTKLQLDVKRKINRRRHYCGGAL